MRQHRRGPAVRRRRSQLPGVRLLISRAAWPCRGISCSGFASAARPVHFAGNGGPGFVWRRVQGRETASSAGLLPSKCHGSSTFGSQEEEQRFLREARDQPPTCAIPTSSRFTKSATTAMSPLSSAISSKGNAGSGHRHAPAQLPRVGRAGSRGCRGARLRSPVQGDPSRHQSAKTSCWTWRVSPTSLTSAWPGVMKATSPSPWMVKC